MIPILVHLTRKQKAKVVEFPSLMFLDRIPFQAESKRRIHHWLLLLLRALAVALIVAAFSRPFFTGPAVAAGSGSGPREVVVLLDRSYSMGVGDRWERGSGSRPGACSGTWALWIGPAWPCSVEMRRFWFGPRRTRTRLEPPWTPSTVSDESTSYGPGLKLAQTILEESELPARELVLIGDFQRAGWTGDEGVHLPPGTVVTPVVLGVGVPANRAVARVTLPRQQVRWPGPGDTRRPASPGWEVRRRTRSRSSWSWRAGNSQRQPVVLPANGASGRDLRALQPFPGLHAGRGTIG